MKEYSKMCNERKAKKEKGSVLISRVCKTEKSTEVWVQRVGQNCDRITRALLEGVGMWLEYLEYAVPVLRKWEYNKTDAMVQQLERGRDLVRTEKLKRSNALNSTVQGK